MLNKKNIMMQRTANENAACIRRICKRPDQPKIERLVNNDARVILQKKLNATIESKLKPRIEGIQFGLYRVVAPLSFLRTIRLASLFTMPYKVSRNQSTSSPDED